jgi:hypothetical protein
VVARGVSIAGSKPNKTISETFRVRVTSFSTEKTVIATRGVKEASIISEKAI